MDINSWKFFEAVFLLSCFFFWSLLPEFVRSKAPTGKVNLFCKYIHGIYLFIILTKDAILGV